MKNLVTRLRAHASAPLAIRILTFCAFVSSAFSASSSYAIEFKVDKDDFDGTTSVYYTVTTEEFQKYEMTFVIREYHESDDTVWIGIAPSGGATSCDKNYVLFKDASGEIHKADFEEKNLTMCVGRIPAAWLRGNFSIRLPMYQGRKDGSYDASGLDFSKIKG